MTAPARVVIGDAELWHGDCRDVLPLLDPVSAVVTDPPYGILNVAGESLTAPLRKSSCQLGSGKLRNRILNTSAVEWDIAPSADVFDALRAISAQQIIWGGNYFDLPPTRGMLVWDKQQPWENFSQVEIAWTNLCRPAAIFRESATRGTPDKVHPTQKPLSLMVWCVAMLDGGTVLDPYMGSGTTGSACAQIGKAFIGIERDRKYFDIACARIEAAQRQGRLLLPHDAPQKPVQEAMEYGD